MKIDTISDGGSGVVFTLFVFIVIVLFGIHTFSNIKEIVQHFGK